MAALPPQWVNQAQAQADADELLPWVAQQMNNPFNLMPENIKIIIERWVPIIQSLSDSDPLRIAIADWINQKTGASPPS
jgi:hypothetical protein